VQATGGVLSFTRQSGDDVAVVLISFAGDAQTTAVTVPSALAATPRWRDELSGDLLAGGTRMEIPMQGHGVRVLVPAG
jgi:hypothetical protein